MKPVKVQHRVTGWPRHSCGNLWQQRASREQERVRSYTFTTSIARDARRRAVAAQQAHSLAIDQWLAGEVCLRGIRENAAVVAVLEMPGGREEIAQEYRQQHPDRVGALNDLLAVLD